MFDRWRGRLWFVLVLLDLAWQNLMKRVSPHRDTRVWSSCLMCLSSGGGNPRQPAVRPDPHHPVHILLFPAARVQPSQCCRLCLWTHHHHGHGESCNTHRSWIINKNLYIKSTLAANHQSISAHVLGGQAVSTVQHSFKGLRPVRVPMLNHRIGGLTPTSS